jgi:hypothetical protein
MAAMGEAGRAPLTIASRDLSAWPPFARPPFIERTQSANPSPVAVRKPRFGQRRRPGDVALQAPCLRSETLECAETPA